MERSITLAVDVAADATHLFEILSTSDGQRGFWTADCDVDAERAPPGSRSGRSQPGSGNWNQPTGPNPVPPSCSDTTDSPRATRTPTWATPPKPGR